MPPEPLPDLLLRMQRGLRHTGRRALALCTLLSALALATGCTESRSASADPQAAARPAATDEVWRGEFTATQFLTGELRSSASEVVLVPRLPSFETTIRFMVADGSTVREGNRLVELDTAQIASELDNKITQQQQALNDLASKEAEIEGQLAQKELAVIKAAIALDKARIEASVPEDIQSRKQFEESRLALETAEIEHQKAVADLAGYRQSSEAEVEATRIDLSKTEREVQEARRAIDTMVLRAPASGIAVASENRREDRKFQEGDTVWIGASVMEIPDLSRMMVRARLSDVDDGKIHPGMGGRCTLDAYPERSFPCTVASITPVAQELGFRSDQRHFNVEIDLDEVDAGIMRPGMSVKVEVITASRSDVLLVPRRGLVLRDDRTFVLTSDGEVEVRLGACNAQACILEEGPAEGTRLAGSR